VLLGAELRFHGIQNTVRALYWLKLRLADDEDFGLAANKIGVRRSYAYELLKLYKHLDDLEHWAKIYQQQHGEYPLPWAMMRHVGVGLGKQTPRGRPIRRDRFIARMQREIERLRAALSESEVRESDLRNKLAERDAQIADLREQLPDGSERSDGHAPQGRYWLTPPQVYRELDREFSFTFDPCPCPLPDGWNGLEIEWGKANYVNPPFRRDDVMHGRGITDFVRKSIAELASGKLSVLILPVPDYVTTLLKAGAEIRPLGRVPFLEAETGEPAPHPPNVAVFVLRP
jgi:hypothetical protein